MAKIKIDVFVSQITQNGEVKYPNYGVRRGIAEFSKSLNTCTFEGLTFKKIKGGYKGGNYQCNEDRNIYRISQNKTN